MRKLRTLLCALCLALLVPLLVRAWRVLPLDSRSLVAEKYAGWSGVLRLWIYEGWTGGEGSLSGWVNACAARFEKRHPGVYVQPRYVDAGAIASMNDSGILRPDMLLIPPRLLDGPEGLLPLETPDSVRPELARSGLSGGRTYAVPIAMGGYLWAWNAALIERIPDSWRESGLSPAVPEPEERRHWGAALLALCAGQSDRAEDPASGTSQPGTVLDFNLPDTATAAPSPAPEPSEDTPGRMPEGFGYDGEAWRRFVDGEAPALLVTQREVRRLQRLSEQGRGPDWRLSAGSCAFSDQLLSLAVVDQPDAAQRQALCLEFLDCLLEEECQGMLCRAGVFSVTGAPSGYAAGDPLSILDAALRDGELRVPGTLDAEWPDRADEIVREFLSGSADSPALWQRFCESLDQNPNDLQ